MNPEVKALWLKWLRDPNNRQATGQLREWDRDEQGDKVPAHCCLGGLCEIYLHEKGGKWITGDSFVDDHGDESFSELPSDVVEWAGLNDAIGSLNEEVSYSRVHPRDPVATCLIHLNDDAGFTFAQIADVIEEQF